MTRQSISIDDELLEILKKKAAESERSLSKEIAYRLKMSLRLEEGKPDKKNGE
jgi:ribosomal protein L18E